MASTVPETEAELEAFRQQWRDEVSAKNKRVDETKAQRQHDHNAQRRKDTVPAGPSLVSRRQEKDYSEEVEPRTYHDLPDKEEQLKLGTEGQNHDRDHIKEPSSALEHYEHAVEKETHGQLGDSIKHYRKAFKVRSIPHMSSHCLG